MIPTEVDCIILGTGLTNSILAAACSRIGKSVLHVDKNHFYGDEWASFTFQQLIDWIKKNYPYDDCLKSVPEELIAKSRMFCIDLCPRLLYSNGSMVDLLVKSNVSRYHEFKNNIRILSMVDNQLHVMPCRRNEVFTSSLLPDLVDKRRLMKFIELCIEFNPEMPETSDIYANREKPIKEFLTERGLNHHIKEYVINSIAMVDPTSSTLEACKKIKNFMVATERFGRSPFIFPLYGCGEFPQSFCRLSAVFGGTYCLNTSLESVKISSSQPTSCSNDKKNKEGSGENFVARFSNSEQDIKSDMLVMDYNSAFSLNLTTIPRAKDKLSRAILITKKSIVSNDENLTSFLRIPPTENVNPHLVYLLELNSSVMVCPSDINIVYLWTKATANTAESDLKPTIERLFGHHDGPEEGGGDKIEWKFYFQQLTGLQSGVIRMDEIQGLHITSPPCNDIDYSLSIKEAEEIFRKMCPDQEFLPRAPDPDEIIT